MTMPESSCQIVRTLSVVGEKWSLLIVRNALRGQTRFSEFRDNLGAPTDVLADRLAKLVAAGILAKRPYREPGGRERSSYHLTERGEALRVIVAAMMQWGDEFNPTPHDPVSRLVDADSGEPVRLAYLDAEGRELEPGSVEIMPGRAGAWASL